MKSDENDLNTWRLKLTNSDYKNFQYESVQLEFTDGVHVFIGENAQGKTNLNGGRFIP